MLDASIRVQILNLLLDLPEEYDLTFLFITHDLAQARYVENDIVIMYLGKMMEYGPVEDVVKKPIHPYTRALISNVPVPDPTIKRDKIAVRGDAKCIGHSLGLQVSSAMPIRRRRLQDK